jgi:hypothetical protein
MLMSKSNTKSSLEDIATSLCCGEREETIIEGLVRSSNLSEDSATELVVMVKKVVDRTLTMANKGIAPIE